MATSRSDPSSSSSEGGEEQQPGKQVFMVAINLTDSSPVDNTEANVPMAEAILLADKKEAQIQNS